MENKLRDLRDCGLFENNSPHWNVTYQSLHTKMIEYLKESTTVCKVKDIPCLTSCTSIGGCLRILVNKRKLQTVKTWRSHESIPKRVERWILRNWLIHPVSVYFSCLLGITRFVPEASIYQRTKNRKKGKPRKIKRELNWNFPFCNFPFPISWSPQCLANGQIYWVRIIPNLIVKWRGVNLRQSTCHFTSHWRNINGFLDKNQFEYPPIVFRNLFNRVLSIPSVLRFSSPISHPYDTNQTTSTQWIVSLVGTELKFIPSYLHANRVLWAIYRIYLHCYDSRIILHIVGARGCFRHLSINRIIYPMHHPDPIILLFIGRITYSLF